MTLTATLRVDARAELGEGPVWDQLNRELLWVDIVGGAIHRFRPADGHTGPSLALGRHVGAVVPRRNGGMVVAMPGAIAMFEPRATEAATLVPIADEPLGNRLNDGACDPHGRFWVGSLAYDESVGAGSLYRLDPSLTVTRVVAGVTVSNGLGWSPDGATMYYVDTPTRCVDAFSFDAATGAIGDRRRVINIPRESGLPDGLTVDAEGGIWVALWGGGAVNRYLPDGTLAQAVELPCRQVTSCAFGGDALDELFITTAAKGLSADDLAHQPGAGGLFSCRPGVIGMPSVPFAG